MSLSSVLYSFIRSLPLYLITWNFMYSYYMLLLPWIVSCTAFIHLHISHLLLLSLSLALLCLLWNSRYHSNFTIFHYCLALLLSNNMLYIHLNHFILSIMSYCFIRFIHTVLYYMYYYYILALDIHLLMHIIHHLLHSISTLAFYFMLHTIHYLEALIPLYLVHLYLSMSPPFHNSYYFIRYL